MYGEPGDIKAEQVKENEFEIKEVAQLPLPAQNRQKEKKKSSKSSSSSRTSSSPMIAM